MTRKQLIRRLCERRRSYVRTARTGRLFEQRLRAEGKLRVVDGLLKELGVRGYAVSSKTEGK